MAGFVLSRYIVQQHQSMSYEKSVTGDRCLLQVDGQKVFSPGGFEKIGIGNPRLGSAIQILKDLGLIHDEAKNGGVPLLLGALAEQRFSEARARGMGDEDMSALVKLW